MSEAKWFPAWEKMTVREIREALAERPSVIVPLGVIEQHGYHLPTCTDILAAHEVCLRVGREIGMLVAPPVNMSFSGGELHGTINVHPNIMGLLVGEVLRSLAAQGVRNLFLVLGHGGSENARSLDNTLKLLLRTDPTFEDVMIAFAPTWKFSPTFLAWFQQKDWHAAAGETSIMLALAPELVQMDRLTLDEESLAEAMREHPDHYQRAEKPIDDDLVVPRMTQRPDVEVGVMGYPEKASAELGQKIVDEMVANMSERFTRLEAERGEYREVPWTPEPIIFT